MHHQSIESRIVERLCDKVQGMHSALQQRDLQTTYHGEQVSLDDAAGLHKVDAHRLSQLESLISSLQAKVETLPRYEFPEAQSVRNDRLRVETSELQQQKDALMAEVMKLQRQKQALSTQGASGARLCGIPAAPIVAASSSVSAGREVRGQAGNVLIPQLRLGQLSDVAASVSPPQSGRAENQAKTLSLPVACGCSFAVPSPRGPEPCSARAPASAAALCTAGGRQSAAGALGARCALRPLPWPRLPVYHICSTRRTRTVQLHHPSPAALGHPDMRDFRWTYQTPQQVQHGTMTMGRR